MRKLAGLQFKFVYKKGVENVVADALSRVGVHYHLDAISTTIPFWIQEVLNSYENDPEASALLQELVISSPNDRGYSFTDGIIRHKNRIWIGQNSPLQTKLISTFHTSALGGHSGIQATYQRLKKMFHWLGIKQDVGFFVKQCSVCQEAKHEL
jgi:hypothetical protein